MLWTNREILHAQLSAQGKLLCGDSVNRDSMGVKYLKCKLSEAGEMMKADLLGEDRCKLFGLCTFHHQYRSDPSRLISSLMGIVTGRDERQIVLLDPFKWLKLDTESGFGYMATSIESDESDNEAEDVAWSQHSVATDLLFSFVSWFLNHSNRDLCELLIVSPSPLPRRYLALPIERIEPSVVDLPSHDIQVCFGSTVVSTTSRCICLRGNHGKTSTLFEIESRYKCVWLQTQEIVNCELGESGRIIRSLFTKASMNRPGIVLMDDADLTLNTSGRIIKEIIEEIGSCIDDFGPSVKFIFSCIDPVDSFIESKIDHLIDL
jgi:hypothetical protein